jgi:regulator of sigma E protease
MPDVVKGVFYLLIILSVLVVAHEFGHYAVAKLLKMRVEDFSLFFGPVLVRLGRRGDTVYNIRTIPFGGFVRVAGMDPDDISGGRPILEALRHPRFEEPEAASALLKQLDTDTMVGLDPAKIGAGVRTMIRSAVGADGRLTEEGKADLAALLRSPGISTDEHRLIELAINADARRSDPGLFNQRPIYQRALVIAAGPIASLLFGYFVFCVMGMTVGLPAGETTNQVLEVRRPGAAYDAGLRIGDRIVAINGTPTPKGRLMVDKIHGSLGVPLLLTVDRSGQQFLARVTPRPMDVSEGRGPKHIVGVIGIVPDTALTRYGPAKSIRLGTLYTLAYLRQLVLVFRDTKQVKENVGGPIAMGQMATAFQRLGIAHLVNMAASLSLGLGVINLLPIPIMDGGHLLLLGVEVLRRRKLSPREVYRAQVVGLGIIVLIVAFVMLNDISRTISGHALQ